MKKITLLMLLSLLCSVILNTNAQQYIKIDASFYSPVLDEVKKIDIYLPSNYYENPEQEYATIYYLHGGNGNQDEGNNNAMFYYNLHGQDSEITSPPAIFVCPNGACEPYVGSMYLNSELYGNYEDYIMQDVIGFVESNFRAKSDKNFRMITGISMGGFGSASLSSKYPEKFRACIPMSGGFSMPDTLLNNFRTKCYQEQGTYDLHYPAGYYTAVFFTFCGGFSPNIDIEPNHVEIPFDTLGIWQDTVLSKWSQHEIYRRVKNLPDENELAWFLICGKQDNLAFFPSYKDFTDSLDYYGIGYDTSYFEGTHEMNIPSWITAIHWMDSIINLSYISQGVPIIQQPFEQISIYPNPVSNQVKISYQLNNASSVKIDLFDQQGRKMKELMNCYQQIGSFQDEWNISSIPSGLYYLRLQTEKSYVTKKIIKVN